MFIYQLVTTCVNNLQLGLNYVQLVVIVNIN